MSASLREDFRDFKVGKADDPVDLINNFLSDQKLNVLLPGLQIESYQLNGMIRFLNDGFFSNNKIFVDCIKKTFKKHKEVENALQIMNDILNKRSTGDPKAIFTILRNIDNNDDGVVGKKFWCLLVLIFNDLNIDSGSYGFWNPLIQLGSLENATFEDKKINNFNWLFNGAKKLVFNIKCAFTGRGLNISAKSPKAKRVLKVFGSFWLACLTNDLITRSSEDGLRWVHPIGENTALLSIESASLLMGEKWMVKNYNATIPIHWVYLGTSLIFGGVSPQLITEIKGIKDAAKLVPRLLLPIVIQYGVKYLKDYFEIDDEIIKVASLAVAIINTGLRNIKTLPRLSRGEYMERLFLLDYPEAINMVNKYVSIKPSASVVGANDDDEDREFIAENLNLKIFPNEPGDFACDAIPIFKKLIDNESDGTNFPEFNSGDMLVLLSKSEYEHMANADLNTGMNSFFLDGNLRTFFVALAKKFPEMIAELFTTIAVDHKCDNVQCKYNKNEHHYYLPFIRFPFKDSVQFPTEAIKKYYSGTKCDHCLDGTMSLKGEGHFKVITEPKKAEFGAKMVHKFHGGINDPDFLSVMDYVTRSEDEKDDFIFCHTKGDELLFTKFKILAMQLAGTNLMSWSDLERFADRRNLLTFVDRVINFDGSSATEFSFTKKRKRGLLANFKPDHHYSLSIPVVSGFDVGNDFLLSKFKNDKFLSISPNEPEKFLSGFWISTHSNINEIEIVESGHKYYSVSKKNTNNPNDVGLVIEKLEILEGNKLTLTKEFKYNYKNDDSNEEGGCVVAVIFPAESVEGGIFKLYKNKIINTLGIEEIIKKQNYHNLFNATYTFV